ncbi:unnamed protein product, partial [Musa banksii]
CAPTKAAATAATPASRRRRTRRARSASPCPRNSWRRRQRPEGQHLHAGAAGPPHPGAAPLPGRHDPEERPQAQDQELRPRLQAGGRALLHPRRRPRSAGRAREEPRTYSTPHGAVEDDGAQVRQHLQQLPPLRAILLRGQRPDEQTRPGVADRVRVRVQVQQCRLERPPHRQWRSQESMYGGDRQVSEKHVCRVAYDLSISLYLH